MFCISADDFFTLLIPKIIESGDIIEVSTARGRQRNGVVNNARDIKMGISGLLLTKIEIKQSKGN